MVNDATPRLITGVTDQDANDGDHATVTFEIYRSADNLRKFTGTSSALEPGADRPFETPSVSPALPTNTTYYWRARAYDGNSYSAWSAPCYFYIDTSLPPPPDVTHTELDHYTLNTPVTFKFTSSSSDVTGFRYSLNSFSPGTTVISKSSGTLTVTPQHQGPWFVRVWSVDAVGNTSRDYGEEELIVEGQRPVGHWLFDEGTGTSSVDQTTSGNFMYLGSRTSWVDGNNPDRETPKDHAVFFDGLNSQGGTAATTAQNLIDTRQNFSVVARVRLEVKSSKQVIVSEDQAGQSAFSLGTSDMTWDGKDTADPSDDSQDVLGVKWQFTISTSGGPATVTTPNFVDYTRGEWVTVAAVYTGGSHAAEVFVDGVSVARSDEAFPTNLQAVDGTGPFRLGLGIENSAVTNFFRGDVDDVWLYDGRISDQIIRNITQNGE
jgi:hypothetical protein